jgi:hypothetical protein
MVTNPQRPAVRARNAVILAVCTILSACSTAQIDSIPANLGGLPQGTPERPAVPPAFPAVHDMPPQRAPMLDEDQQKRLEDDLIATRNRQPGQKPETKQKAEAKQKADAKRKPATGRDAGATPNP